MLELGAGYQIQASKFAIPTLDSTRENVNTETLLGAALHFGVTEFFPVGVSGKFMADQAYRLKQSGIAFAENSDSVSHNQGFYDAGFQMGLRLFGTRTEEWFVDVELGFIPGVQDSNNFLLFIPMTGFWVVYSSAEIWSFGRSA